MADYSFAGCSWWVFRIIETSSPVDFYVGLLALDGKQVLTPTVQHGKEGDLCAEMFGVDGNLEQALGGALEQ